jgi:hypothetical protein
MVSRTSDWRDELGRWLKPFLDRLGHKARRQMCPLYGEARRLCCQVTVIRGHDPNYYRNARLVPSRDEL